MPGLQFGQMPEITLTHSTDTAHRLVGHEGKCARLHGHTYNWRVRVLAVELLPIGFVADFGTIKAALNEWDHRCLLWQEDPMAIAFMQPVAESQIVVPDAISPSLATLERMMAKAPDIGVIRVPFNPTAEHMASAMSEHLFRALEAENPTVHRVEVELAETASSRAYAAWDASGQRGAP